MIGYIKTYQPELKMKDYVRYNAYYCGICHSMKKRWGELVRITLNYDCVFIAMFIDSLLKNEIQYENFRCAIHPIIKKKKTVNNATVDFIADMNIYLSYIKILDNIEDENNILHKSSELVIRKYAKEMEKNYPKLTDEIKRNIDGMYLLEKRNCDNIDEVAECYANIIQKICAYKLAGLSDELIDFANKISYNVGKWVYSADAFDDIEKDVKKGMFNPYLTRFKYDKSESYSQFKDRIKDRISFILYAPLKIAADTYEDFDDDYKDPVIENVLFEGLYDRTEKILNGDKKLDNE